MDYLKAGVNLKEASTLTGWLSNQSISGFCSFTEHPALTDYYICCSSDGVGTKIIPLYERKMFDVIAQDLVAMCLNDLVTSGAKPFLFMDNISCENFDLANFKQIIFALKKILKTYNCELVGGETAELKGIITPTQIEISGFSLGFVKKKEMLGPHKVQKGDVIISLASSGPHSNGFTLIRQLHKQSELNDYDLTQCLNPTHIYVKEVLELAEHGLINSCANITGGGISENLSRAIPEGLCFNIKPSNIHKSKLFEKLEYILGKEEAYKVFNMGSGYCIITSKEHSTTVLKHTERFNSTIIGEIV